MIFDIPKMPKPSEPPSNLMKVVLVIHSKFDNTYSIMRRLPLSKALDLACRLFYGGTACAIFINGKLFLRLLEDEKNEYIL